MFMMPEHAVNAFNSLDGSVFQGRMLHLLPAKAKKEAEETDDLSFKKKKEAEAKKRRLGRRKTRSPTRSRAYLLFSHIIRTMYDVQ